MKTSTIASILAFSSTAFAACSRQGSVELTFFGFPDNDPPSANTAYNCGGRNYVAGGSGTYDDPLTMASAQGEFSQCEIAYVPYLKKYVRYEDYCQQCTDDFNNGGRRHIDIWTGSSTVTGGNEQVDCENKLTPNGDVVIVRSPAGNYEVDSAPLYHKGTKNPCRTNHVYPDAKAHDSCP
ncbi:hypothetical protein BKA65DRAFT_410328 [Rhexocercosporidium sp. MPI-PUGE-AT-0058]|nr:hypothetical protein BKA65DRAFT_410328 [Rhexocercosporidium sp. MPI-PUGE-AT-0058]